LPALIAKTNLGNRPWLSLSALALVFAAAAAEEHAQAASEVLQ
jgi:hypothetical protein